MRQNSRPAANVVLRTGGRVAEKTEICWGCGGAGPFKSSSVASDGRGRSIYVKEPLCSSCKATADAEVEASPLLTPAVRRGLTVLWVRSRSAATQRGKMFNLSETDLRGLWVRQGGRCAVSGEAMLWDAQPKSLVAPSIDRIESSGHYTPDNVWLVCWAVNLMKNEMSVEQLGFWAQRIVLNALSVESGEA